MYYIYILFNKNKLKHNTINALNLSLLYEPYYVGKGIHDRVHAHKRIKNTKHKKDATTKSLLIDGYDFDELYIKIPISNDESEVFLLEEKIISEIGLTNLTNIASGGIGGSGKIRRNKTYKEIYGDRADEIKNKISKSNSNKIASQETKNKLSAKLTQYYSKEENKSKHSKDLIGRIMPKSFKEKNSKRFKNVPKSKEQRNKMSIAAKGKTQTEEHKRNAAFARAKYKGILTINNNEYKVIRSTFRELLSKYNIKHNNSTFYKIIKDNTILEQYNVKFELIKN